MHKVENVMYMGQPYEVKLLTYPGKNTQIILRDGKFIVYINNRINENKQMPEAIQALRLWMIEKAQDIIRARTEELSKVIGVVFNNIRIKDTKTRWGSCSSKGNLNFNFRIVMSPEVVMDYIIIHELCHLKHMNHSQEFWRCVESYMPDYPKYKDWLRKKGMELYKL